MYIDAIRDNRLGDAMWARYHIFGDRDGDDDSNGNAGLGAACDCVDDPARNMTVMDVIKEDALGYKVFYPEEYFEAMVFYAATSAEDGRGDLIEVIANLSEEGIVEFKARDDAESEEE
ncbi:hypothetical protein BJX64DRAFT_288216 [Aspergillus heterothallicus]